MRRWALYHVKWLTFVGHSLGGGLASLAGAITKSKTITFNSAGVRQSTLNRADINNYNFDNITPYIHRGDVLKFGQEDYIYTRNILPDPLGQPIYYGNPAFEIMPGTIPLGKLFRIGSGVINHTDFKK